MQRHVCLDDEGGTEGQGLSRGDVGHVRKYRRTYRAELLPLQRNRRYLRSLPRSRCPQGFPPLLVSAILLLRRVRYRIRRTAWYRLNRPRPLRRGQGGDHYPVRPCLDTHWRSQRDQLPKVAQGKDGIGESNIKMLFTKIRSDPDLDLDLLNIKGLLHTFMSNGEVKRQTKIYNLLFRLLIYLSIFPSLHQVPVYKRM